MKRFYRLKCFILMVSFIVFVGIATTFLTDVKRSNYNKDGLNSLKLSGNPVISIQGDLELINASSAGTGTRYDPLIIQGLNINGNENVGISIMLTNLYFTLRSCQILNASHGISLYEVNNGRIYDNIIAYCLKGISTAGECHDITIDENEIYNNEEIGIDIESSGYFIIRDNQVYNNGGSGIYIWSNTPAPAQHNVILSHEIYNNSLHGIVLMQGSRNDISLNTIYNNGMWGIIIKANGNKIELNSVHDNGYGCIYIDMFSPIFFPYLNIMIDNTFDGLVYNGQVFWMFFFSYIPILLIGSLLIRRRRKRNQGNKFLFIILSLLFGIMIGYSIYSSILLMHTNILWTNILILSILFTSILALFTTVISFVKKGKKQKMLNCLSCGAVILDK